MPGDTLLNTRVGNVKLTRKLGAGAMGAVYLGWHESFACEVAVKFLTSTSSNSRERFLREGRAAAKIDHEHVIRVLDAGETAGKAYLVLEFVNGRSLGEILDAQEASDRKQPPVNRPPGSLPDPGVVAHLGAQLARGLAAIHLKGIVHRDIKPDNLLISHAGRAKIADLGLAKQLDDPDLIQLTGSGMVVGTPLYVSPEGIRNPQAITGAADVYSLGATLYHLLSGKPPFEGKTAYEVMRGHLEETLRPLRELRPDLPRHLIQTVEGCLAKAPNKRPTPLQVADALENGQSRGNRRKLFLAIGGVAAALALTAGLGYALLLPKPAAGTMSGPTDAKLLVGSERTNLLIRIDQGPWLPVKGAVPIASGRRQIAIRADQDGPTWAWNGQVDVIAGAPASISPDLRPIEIPAVRHALPGDGLLYRDGTALGDDAQVTFLSPGRYSLGRWNGPLWNTQSVTVADTGAITVTASGSVDRPGGLAWFRQRDDQGRPCPAHHVTTWREAELMRLKADIPEPVDWRRQGTKPDQPVIGMGPMLLVPLAQKLTALTAARLPTADEAATLRGFLNAPVWTMSQNVPRAVGGNPGVALLVFVPP